jgi:beta-N-acetylhexosaminidase/D-alanyl-D-alanine dipeptidase
LFSLALVACSAPHDPHAALDPPVPVPGPSATPPDAAWPVPDGFVDVEAAIPDVVLDLRYASDRNITGAPIYPVARCLLADEVADRLAAAAAELRDAGYRLVMWDCYRPFSMQQVLWDRVKDPRYAAEPVVDKRGRPVKGSVHSRGAAVDVSLADASGALLAMPTDHDDFTRAALRRRPKDPDVRTRM